MTIRVDQDDLTITLSTGKDVSTATASFINYKKPNGYKGQWTATVSGTNIVYEVQDGDLNQAGTWRLQGEVVVAGKRSFTDPVDLVIKKEFEG
jgi:hypothetical protein